MDVNLSTTEKKYKETILEFVGKIVEDLDLINTEEHAAEILVEYKKTLNASQSITMVRQRKEQERLEKERLIKQRTDKRVAQLHKIAFVYSDIAHAYYFVHNNAVSIPVKDIETLENDTWNQRYASFELEVEKHAKKDTPEVLQAPTTSPTSPISPTSTEQPKEEIHQAKFCVQGTMGELMKLKEFLQHVRKDKIQLTITSPPYADFIQKSLKDRETTHKTSVIRLENNSTVKQYSQEENDFGNLPYPEFLEQIKHILKDNFAVTKVGGYSCWVVKDYRDTKNKVPYVPFHSDLARAGEAVGWKYHDLIIWDQTGQRRSELLDYPSVFYTNQNCSFIVVFRKVK